MAEGGRQNVITLEQEHERQWAQLKGVVSTAVFIGALVSTSWLLVREQLEIEVILKLLWGQALFWLPVVAGAVVFIKQGVRHNQIKMRQRIGSCWNCGHAAGKGVAICVKCNAELYSSLRRNSNIEEV